MYNFSSAELVAVNILWASLGGLSVGSTHYDVLATFQSIFTSTVQSVLASQVILTL